MSDQRPWECEHAETLGVYTLPSGSQWCMVCGAIRFDADWRRPEAHAALRAQHERGTR